MLFDWANNTTIFGLDAAIYIFDSDMVWRMQLMTTKGLLFMFCV